MTDRVWQVPQDQFEAAWNNAGHSTKLTPA